jgi:two-component system phosphate regulon sensor histidine kinase PhoR
MKAEEKQIALKPECPGDLEAMINSDLLEQALVNLLDNAVKYSDEGKSVWIKAYTEKTGTRIEVRDEGCGIPEEHLPRLFERFYRVDKARSRKMGGTGLGLAIVKHITQAHGGGIKVSSEVGKGSVFTITLPAG